MTVIKQKAVSSSRHAKNVRKYINGKDALARGGWNLPYNKYWYAKMARTRKSFGHDKPARAGAKNTIMYHQVLAFLPEECSCNGGKMTPDACMAYAEQWLAKHYPHQQVIRNRYASAVPDYGEDNVRAAGQAGTHSVQQPVIESGRTREQSDKNVEH